MFGTVSFFPKSATPALVIVPFRVTLVLPEVFEPGLAQLAVPFTASVTLVNSTTVGSPLAVFLPRNASTQPLKFDGGAVDARPLTALGGDRYAFLAAPAPGPQAFHA